MFVGPGISHIGAVSDPPWVHMVGQFASLPDYPNLKSTGLFKKFYFIILRKKFELPLFIFLSPMRFANSFVGCNLAFISHLKCHFGVILDFITTH